MIPLSEAQDYVIGQCDRLPATEVSIRDARGMVTASAVAAAEHIPPFSNTAVDGYAVQAADTSGASDSSPVSLAVVGTIAAGDAPTMTITAGQAAKIMTGAPLPDGADAVVMVEVTESTGDDVLVSSGVAVGQAVRNAGEDLQPGDLVFDAGTELTPGHLGVLASIGRYDVEVWRKPKVGVFSTGDELVESSRPLEPGQIRDSNRYTLLSLLERDDLEVVDLGVIPDAEDLIEEAVRRGVNDCDALLTSGGVSMGDYDYVKAVLDQIGDMRWMQVGIKPAKPLAFGLVDGVPVFGLPGNPVSSMVSFELFARPALRRMMGHSQLHRPRLIGSTAQPWPRRPDGKTHFIRVKVDRDNGIFALRSAGGQGSHQLTAMAGADALAVLADGDGVHEGDVLEFFFIN